MSLVLAAYRLGKEPARASKAGLVLLASALNDACVLKLS